MKYIVYKTINLINNKIYIGVHRTNPDINIPSNIIAAIQGKQKRCNGYRWRYFYGNTSDIKSL